ncbi:NlpC/P60 family protein [Mangrovihabitans endophyticus]|uniref:NlpC/P60 family protein n=1 Tax=Mangrovihabitans endophyticus TaxID=1751298 RepID=A0A8J3C5B4_9ACTN|nr:NlpC/P60 family protein [Mangrovihabitans endophyticus]GGL12724.1 hypothetical protein GCM10012284_54280 [Mangrovihabitans endophyticus]
MTGRLLALITAAAVTAVAAVAVLAALGGAASGCLPTPSSGSVRGFDTHQRRNAAIIVQVADQRGLPDRAAVIAVAVAMRESQLHNIGDLGDNNDHDSLGLFQQRPSQGWGTPQQIMNPAYAAGRFYDTLLGVEHWQHLPLTVAAQAVQNSAYPGAYAAHEPDATALVAATIRGPHDGAAAAAGLCGGTGCPSFTPPPDGSGGCAGLDAVFARARSWLTAWPGGRPVPYLSSNAPADLFGGYRRDCSGYLSMALGLPGPGLDTITLAARSTIITPADLHPGDLMIKPAAGGAGHVVLFAGWTGTSRSSYWGYEQSGDGGTHYRQIPYPYFGGYAMTPYRARPATTVTNENQRSHDAASSDPMTQRSGTRAHPM